MIYRQMNSPIPIAMTHSGYSPATHPTRQSAACFGAVRIIARKDLQRPQLQHSGTSDLNPDRRLKVPLRMDGDVGLTELCTATLLNMIPRAGWASCRDTRPIAMACMGRWHCGSLRRPEVDVPSRLVWPRPISPAQSQNADISACARGYRVHEPGAILRKLSAEEMAAYRRPFASPGEADADVAPGRSRSRATPPTCLRSLPLTRTG
jgi:hypothetical protein